MATAQSVLENHLSHLHVLSDTPDELLYQSNQTSSAQDVDLEADYNEAEVSYCEVKGCGRMFPHKHISSEKDNNQTTSSLLLNETAGSGTEALDKSYLSSL